MVFDDMLKDQLILHRNLPRLFFVTQEWYDLLQTKDPHTIYIILNAKDRRVYHGDILISVENQKPRYFLSISPSKEYQIHINYHENYTDRLILISTYTDINTAIKDLTRFNNVGSHIKWATQAYRIIYLYIRKDISLQEFLIGMISLFGYRDHPMLQTLIEYSLSLGVDMRSNTPCMELVENLPHFKSRHFIFRMYSDLYDLVVLFNFFKDAKYHDFTKDIDLSDFIDRLPRIFIPDIPNQINPPIQE